MKVQIKKLVNKTQIGRYIVEKKDSLRDKFLFTKREPYLSEIQRLMSIGGGNCSIISYNCFGGRIINDIGMQYNTPTVGLYFMYPDYIEFLQHLDYYLKEAKIQFVDHSKYPGYDEKRDKWKFKYPIGLLDGKVEIHFLHYHTEEEAAEKWYRRARRINWGNLLVFGMEQNLCTDDDIGEFDKLPFERKFFFSSKKMPGVKSNCFVKEFAGLGHVGDPWKQGHYFYKALVEKLNGNEE